MRILLWLLLVAAIAFAQAPPPLPADQQKVVEKVLDFYKKMGEKDGATQLKQGIEAGDITFGPTEGNANAHCDMSSDKRPIRINPEIVDKVNQASMESYREIANLANTLCHELKHRKQDKWAWKGSFWQETFGQGNPCEQEAWAHSMERWHAWLNATHNELRAKANASARERAEIGLRLKMLSQACKVQVNSYQERRARIGKLRMEGTDGVPMTLEDLNKHLAAYDKIARDTIGLADALQPLSDGLYQGTLSGPGLSGIIGLKVEGYVVTGLFRGEYQGDSFKGDVVRGQMDKDGNLTMEVWGMALVKWPKIPEPVEQSFAAKLTGTMGKTMQASGSFTASNGKVRFSGNWSAARVKR